VDKETWKVYQMWREADLLGPPKNGSEQRLAAGSVNGTPKPQDAGAQDTLPDVTTAGPVAVTNPKAIEVPWAEPTAPSESQLEGPPVPPLEQPDENDRPKADPQLDTAVLLLKIQLVAESHPTLATAEVETAKDTAKP
jgi:hypothetical protein